MAQIPITSFQSKFTLLRDGGGSYDSSGRWVAGQRQQISLFAVVQPMAPEEQQTLPEGLRARRSYNVWAESKLKVLSSPLLQDGDVIVIDGRECKVVSVKAWTQLIPHFHAVAVAKEEDAQ